MPVGDAFQPFIGIQINRHCFRFGFDLGKYALKICVMKTIPIMQAQHNLSKVLRSMAPGERVAITRNKKIVAELVAPLEQKALTLPDFAARARATWGGAWQGRSSDALLEESRGSR
ncbi:MAG: type II toxin-antitoxin system Phd/YefM family antitoxin [Opitutales bacterium]|nr:type II toxin-antitoxin system Phd/YefM family antitoxin [Opitutales bacterium]